MRVPVNVLIVCLVKVLSLCFSADGWALAVGHEGALTVWSTEDGTRLVCTTSESRGSGDGGGGGARTETTTTAPGTGTPPHGGGAGEEEGYRQSPGPLSPSRASAASGTLDLIAGGARALSWESEGYRLMSVGSAVGKGGGADGGAAAAAAARGQGIVAFDFLRRARSNLSSSLLSLQVCKRLTERPITGLPTLEI